jgi:hypothetical protein
MQYYDTALEHLSTIDLESFRSILPETIHPFVLLSYPIRSEREVGGNSSASSRYGQQDFDVGQHGSGSGSGSGSGVRNGDAQRDFVDGHGDGYGVGPSSATVGSYRSAATDSSSSSDCQPRPPYTSYYNAPSSSSTSIPASSYNHNLPLCEPLTIPHPSTHPYNLFYDKGPNDALFVIFWAVTFTILREALMRWAYRPFARWYLCRLDIKERERNRRLRMQERKQLQAGSEKVEIEVMERTEERLSKKEQKLRDRVIVRFAEQAWTCTYATVFWCLGFVSSRSTNPLTTRTTHYD